MRILSLCLILGILLSCKNEKPLSSANDIATLESEYQETKADSSFQRLVQAYGKAILKSTTLDEKENLLLKAVLICNTPEKSPFKEVFAIELLKVNPHHEKAADFIFELAENMELRNKKEAASLLFKGFLQRFPTDPRTKEVSKKILSQQDDLESYLKKAEDAVLSKPNKDGINTENTELFIDLCESYAIAFPKENNAPIHLFKAADMARALGNTPRMLGIYDWIVNYFPSYDKVSLALFLKGFALDSELGKFDAAKEVYEEFLVKFPADSLAKDVKFLLANLGKSPDQMYKEMQKAK